MAYRAAGNDAGASNPIVSYDPKRAAAYAAQQSHPAQPNFDPNSLGGSIAAAAKSATDVATGSRRGTAAPWTPGAGGGWKVPGATPPPATPPPPTDISTPPPPPTNSPFSDAYGSESGPGILEQRFNNRLNGTDPAYNYAVKRGMTDLDNRYSAAGSFNSGAARQGEGDLVAQLTALSQSQLDALAGGASGEHLHKVDSMFNHGLGLASGESGTAGAYDIAAGGAMSKANEAALLLALQKAGVDSKAAQAIINDIFGAAALAA